jgi:Ca-activated chloride channel homolog
MKNYLFLVLLCLPILASSQQEFESADKTLSPYFIVKGNTKGLDALPLKNTEAEVNIAGMIADVSIKQTYINTGNNSLEAIYVFPASENAAVYGLTMQIGKRVITAKIEERNKAKADYEKAKSEGKRASLLEQERPNVFQMNIANIMPNDTIMVTLRYTEILLPESGDYEFVFPTVVGPRYSNGKSTSNNGFTAMPYQKKGEKATFDFNLSLNLTAGVPISDIKSPSHRIIVSDNGISGTSVQFDNEEMEHGNRDFILSYSLRSAQMASGLLLFDDGKEKFFLCMSQPPKQPILSEIPPREYIFVVDVSGSMNGFPLDITKKLMSNLIGNLRKTDRFNVILFAGTSNLLAETSLTANSENIEKAKQFIDKQEGTGGTELLPALERAIKLKRNDVALSRSIVVVTDGYIDVEAEAFELVRNNLDKANLFAFGIGSSVNRHLIDGLAHVGAGIPFIVTNEKEGEKIANKFRNYIATPVFSQAKVSFSGFDAYEVEPSHLPDVFSQRPIILMGKWRGEPQGEIIINGFSGNKVQEIQIPVQNTMADAKNSAIKYLWARERIKLLSDYNIAGSDEKRDKMVTKLGLDYNLLTAFTSFIAIDEEIVGDGKLVKVKQALPLPENVSDLAIGFDLGIEGISGLKFTTEGNNVVAYIISGLMLLILLFCGFVKKKYGLFQGFLIGMATCLISCGESKKAINCEGNNIAFIMGDDKSDKNSYFSNAASFFRTDSVSKTDLQISNCQTLKAVHDYLKSHRPINGKWRQIHLVIHSNEWTGLRVPIDINSPARTTATFLEKSVQNGVFKGFPSENFDKNTCIIVDACNAGQDTALLIALSGAFNGVPVYAARFFNVFEKKYDSEKKINHFLADYRYVVFPSGFYPGNQSVAQQMEEKYPIDTTNWKSALLRKKPRFSGDTHVYTFNIPIKWTILCDELSQRPNLNTVSEKLNWIQNQSELMEQLTTMHLKVDDFRWTLSTALYENGNQSKPAIKIEGAAKIYCIVKPLKNELGQFSEISYKDKKYYAVQSYKS